MVYFVSSNGFVSRVSSSTDLDDRQKKLVKKRATNEIYKKASRKVLRDKEHIFMS
jgi:hypothetical protein